MGFKPPYPEPIMIDGQPSLGWGRGPIRVADGFTLESMSIRTSSGYESFWERLTDEEVNQSAFWLE